MKKIYLVIGAMAVAGAAMASTYDASLHYTDGNGFDKGSKIDDIKVGAGVMVNDGLTVSPSLRLRMYTDSDNDVVDTDANGKAVKGAYFKSHKDTAKAADYTNDKYNRINFGLGVTYKQADMLKSQTDISIQMKTAAYDTKSVEGYKAGEVNSYDSEMSWAFQEELTYTAGVNQIWFGLDKYSTDTDGRKDKKQTGAAGRDYESAQGGWHTDVLGKALPAGWYQWKRDNVGKDMVIGLGYTFADEANSGVTAGVKFQHWAYTKVADETMLVENAAQKTRVDVPGYTTTTYSAGKSTIGMVGSAYTIKDDATDKVVAQKTDFKAQSFNFIQIDGSFKVSDAVTPYGQLGIAQAGVKIEVPKGADESQIADSQFSTASMMTVKLGVKGTY